MSATILVALDSAGAPVSSGLLYRTELLDVLVVAQGDAAVIVLDVAHCTVGVAVLIQLAFPKCVFDTFDVLVDSAFLACHVDVVNVFSREEASAGLELFVEGGRTKAETPGN